MKYPKRLIEVDLPIKRIAEHARNEKICGKDIPGICTSGGQKGHSAFRHIPPCRQVMYSGVFFPVMLYR